MNRREGFQNSAITAITDTPATCAMMNLIVESSNTKLEAAKKRGDQSQVKPLQETYESILAEKERMGC